MNKDRPWLARYVPHTPPTIEMQEVCVERGVNHTRHMRCEIPSSNGPTTTRAVALFYGARDV